MMSMCARRLSQPFLSRSRFSVVYTGSSGSPAFTAGAPPCALSARTVATSTTASGFSPEQRHFMFQNFS